MERIRRQSGGELSKENRKWGNLSEPNPSKCSLCSSPCKSTQWHEWRSASLFARLLPIHDGQPQQGPATFDNRYFWKFHKEEAAPCGKCLYSIEKCRMTAHSRRDGGPPSREQQIFLPLTSHIIHFSTPITIKWLSPCRVFGRVKFVRPWAASAHDGVTVDGATTHPICVHIMSLEGHSKLFMRCSKAFDLTL